MRLEIVQGRTIPSAVTLSGQFGISMLTRAEFLDLTDPESPNRAHVDAIRAQLLCERISERYRIEDAPPTQPSAVPQKPRGGS